MISFEVALARVVRHERWDCQEWLAVMVWHRGRMFGMLPSQYACVAFLLDVNEWLTEYHIRLV